MVSTTKNDRTEKLGITLPKSLLYNLDNKRGDIPRSTFIRSTSNIVLSTSGSGLSYCGRYTEGYASGWSTAKSF